MNEPSMTFVGRAVDDDDDVAPVDSGCDQRTTSPGGKRWREYCLVFQSRTCALMAVDADECDDVRVNNGGDVDLCSLSTQ
jgi:hypothetical protein